MGVYALQEEVHQTMDAARANFFWHGPNMKRKYHMAKWDLMATPKAAGGAGFTNTRVVNKCLLAKWIFKIEIGHNTICCNLEIFRREEHLQLQEKKWIPVLERVNVDKRRV
jgi:hypothetical protein